MQYTAHGSIKIKKSDNVLFIDAQGPFNEVTTNKYQQDIKAIVTQMSDKPWTSLVSFKGNGVFTPDAEQGLTRVTQYRMEHGMIAVAIVIMNEPYADILQMQLQRIYQTCQLKFNFFSEENSAKKWLDSLVN